MLLALLVVATLIASAWLVYVLRQAPEGSICPRCGGNLRRREEGGSAISPLRWVTEAGYCPSCDWRGRVRRGPRAEPVRPETRERGDRT